MARCFFPIAIYTHFIKSEPFTLRLNPTHYTLNPNPLPMKHTPRFLQIVEDARRRITEVTLADVKPRVDKKEKFNLVDVREESEFAAGHIPGAIHLGKGVIERDIENRIPDVGAEIVLYCGGGYRSALAADNLQKMGYTNVKSMDGGFRAWKESGAAIQK
jgi:rhodanese-related sulfurtransferase